MHWKHSRAVGTHRHTQTHTHTYACAQALCVCVPSSGGSEQKRYRLFTRPYPPQLMTSVCKNGGEEAVWLVQLLLQKVVSPSCGVYRHCCHTFEIAEANDVRPVFLCVPHTYEFVTFPAWLYQHEGKSLPPFSMNRHHYKYEPYYTGGEVMRILL